MKTQRFGIDNRHIPVIDFFKLAVKTFRHKFFQSYRNQSIDLQCKSVDRWMYDGKIPFNEFKAIVSVVSIRNSEKIITYPAGIYLLKINNRNTRTRCEICSKLTVKTPERRHWLRFCVFIVNFELISHIVLVFLLLNLKM